MYPYTIFLGLGLYEILIVVGVISALIVFRVYGDKLSLSAKLENLCLIDAVVSVIVGYLSAIFFQAIYNAFEDGIFEINKYTGSTFYGGLIGGVACFIAIYFGFGALFFKENKEHIKNFWTVANIAVCCICIAHSFGRIGCLMAGCCYGLETESFLGVKLATHSENVLPTQLFEAIFLLGLFVFLSIWLLKGKKHNFEIYLISYGTWRFFIEFLRGDDRGATFISFLSPSQLTAILMIIAGIIILLIQIKRNREKRDKNANCAN